MGAIVVRQQLQWLGAPWQRHVGETTKGRIQPGIGPGSGEALTDQEVSGRHPQAFLRRHQRRSINGCGSFDLLEGHPITIVESKDRIGHRNERID